MAGVDGVSGHSGAGVTDTSVGPRDIPSDAHVYQAEGQAASETSGEENELLDAGVQFVAVQVWGLLTKGMSDAKSYQEDAHSKLKEAENEENG